MQDHPAFCKIKTGKYAGGRALLYDQKTWKGHVVARPSHPTARMPSLQSYRFAGAERLVDVVGDAVDAQRLKLDGAFDDCELQHAVENS